MDLEELIVGRHSRCDGLLLLALDSEHGPPRRRRHGYMRHWARSRSLTGWRAGRSFCLTCVPPSRSDRVQLNSVQSNDDSSGVAQTGTSGTTVVLNDMNDAMDAHPANGLCETAPG